MKVTVFLDPADLTVTEEEVARQAGGYGYRPDEDNRRLIAELTAQAGKLITPATRQGSALSCCSWMEERPKNSTVCLVLQRLKIYRTGAISNPVSSTG
ncbi:hypothetical protein [Desulfofustis glycolicus]|uniref:Uncharacterized protein n=1 Tax=Desulfofustis glycolicus DSM 9705 TaxID=1121409 RepID=A0A1M5ULC6_9BACT|nr:hypothetical protein [Desulfofustis glycolicus]MCB2217429.1 hypothetical protein [Desulfobulbaceae bacterium]SHH63781.1 hypothetical protein SAMN02745124_01235 [Desulfofustis glycolicus DSM 9705]